MTKKTLAPSAYQPTRAKCVQCGRELRYVPFNLNNIMCRDCYGLDRYRKHAPVTWTTPEKPAEAPVVEAEPEAEPTAA